MTTKDELQHFGVQIGESSQKSSEELKSCVGEIKDKITKDYEAVILRQSLTITNLQRACEGKARDMEALADKNHSQRCIIAKLNQERDKTIEELKAKDLKIMERDQRILTLQEENHALTVTYYGDGGSHFSEIKSMLTDLWEESKRRRA